MSNFNIKILYKEIDNVTTERYVCYDGKLEYKVYDHNNEHLGNITKDGIIWLRKNKTERLEATTHRFRIHTKKGLKQAVRYIYLRQQQTNG